jgi:hypothetical protein
LVAVVAMKCGYDEFCRERGMHQKTKKEKEGKGGREIEEEKHRRGEWENKTNKKRRNVPPTHHIRSRENADSEMAIRVLGRTYVFQFAYA